MHAGPSAFWCAAHMLCVCVHASIVECGRPHPYARPPRVPAQPEPAHVIFMALFNLQQRLGVARTPTAQVHADDLPAESCWLHLAGDDASGGRRCRLLTKLDAAADGPVGS